MSIEWFRDLVICIFGLAGTILLIFIAILFYLLYWRTRSILISVDKTSKNIEAISSYIGEEVVKPVSRVIAVIESVRQGIEAISKLFKK